MTNSNHLKIGITGGIGSGKSTICHIFEMLGIPVYYADDRAKYLMQEDGAVKGKILDLLGNEAYFGDGRLNRKYISAVIFQDKNKLAALNAIVHPAVIADGEKWNEEQQGVPYTLKEAALLIESKSYQSLDKLIVVTAPEALRVDRVMQRDGVRKEAVMARLKNQITDEARLRHADFVITNDGQQSIIKQVLQIHRQLITFSTTNRISTH